MPHSDEAIQAPTAALLAYRDYRYTVVVSANGLLPEAVEAELWYQTPGAGTRRPWKYFARRTAIGGGKARGTVEAAFKFWVDGQAPAEVSGASGCRWCGAAVAGEDHEEECQACRRAHQRHRQRDERAPGETTSG